MSWNIVYGDSFMKYCMDTRYGWEKMRVFLSLVHGFNMGSRPRQINGHIYPDFERKVLDAVRRDMIDRGVLRVHRKALKPNGKPHRFRYLYSLNPYFWIPSGTKKQRVQDAWDCHVFENYELYEEYQVVKDKYEWTKHEVKGLWI
jgi:hypothetical protein